MNLNLKSYIYDNGFSKRYYICDHCGSKALKQKPSGMNFMPPTYLCMSCNSIVYAPKWECVAGCYNPEENDTDAWLSDSDLAEVILVKTSQLN